jgi:hypothetical protein
MGTTLMPTKYTIEDPPAQTNYTIEDGPSDAPPTLNVAGSGSGSTSLPSLADLTSRSEHKMPHSLSDVGREGVRALSNIGASGIQLLSHPQQLVTSAVMQSPPVQAYTDVSEALRKLRTGEPTSAELEGQDMREHPLETVESLIGQAGAMGAAGEMLGPVSRGLRDTVKSARTAITGTGPETTTKLVKETQAGNAAADAHSAVHASIETARENALRIGNKKYSGVNSALNHFDADPEFMPDAVTDALEKIKGTSTEPTILKDISHKVQLGEVPSYEDLQGYYSELGGEISKGTLPGDLYHAYDTLHEAIGDEMQRIADEHGQGAALTDARQYWRRMKQTFGKPFNANDAATSTLRSLSPEMTEQSTVANRVRMLGGFDPEIPKQFEALQKAQRAAKDVEKPNPGETKKIDEEDVRGGKAQGLQKRAEQVRNVGQRIARYGLGLKALWDGFHGNVESAGSDVALGVVGYKAAGWIADALEKPSVVEFLTRPTAEDIAQIPPELRGSLPRIAAAALATGIKVSPKLLATIGATGSLKGPKTKALESLRDNAISVDQ